MGITLELAGALHEPTQLPSPPPVVWDAVLQRLKKQLPAFTLDAWIRPLSVQVEDDCLRVRCPSAFHRDRVRERLLDHIERCVEEESGRSVPVELQVCPPLPGRPSAPRVLSPSSPPAHPTPTRRVASSREQYELPYAFENFVVGPCNALAREASFAIAHQRQPQLNALFLWSQEPGRGKTHLARSIISEARKRHVLPGRCLYTSAEAFTNEFVASVRENRVDRFTRSYREGCQLLVVEDVQFLKRKKATQTELFHTITHLLDVGARVVVTGNALPRSIEGLDVQLRSRLCTGLVAELEAPDAEVRRKILRERAAAGGVSLPEDCLQLLVDSLRGNVRDLEGVLTQVVASASLLERRIDIDLTRRALDKVVPALPAEACLEIPTIMELVGSFFKLRPEVLASRSRRHEVLVPRQLAMYLCCRRTQASVAEIAHAFGRAHPAVRNAVRRVEKRTLQSAPSRYQLEAISARLDEIARARAR